MEFVPIVHKVRNNATGRRVTSISHLHFKWLLMLDFLPSFIIIILLEIHIQYFGCSGQNYLLFPGLHGFVSASLIFAVQTNRYQMSSYIAIYTGSWRKISQFQILGAVTLQGSLFCSEFILASFNLKCFQSVLGLHQQSASFQL